MNKPNESTPTVAMPPVFHKFLERFLLPMMRMQVNPLFQEPELMEERVVSLIKVFEAHIDWMPGFSALIKSLHAQETARALDEQIRFFTLKHTRNWLVCALMNEVLQLKDLKLDLNTGRFPQRPHDLIPLSYQAMNALGEESRYKNHLFAAGWIFDYILFMSKSPTLNPDGTKIDEVVKQAFGKGLEQARKAVQLSKHKEKLSLEVVTPIIPMLRQAAIVTTMFLDKEALDFQKKAESGKIPETIRCALERKKFGIHTGMIMAFYAQAFDVFGNLGEICSMWPYAYVNWMSGRRDIHDAMGMADLAVALNERLAPKDFQEGKPVGIRLPELIHLDYIAKSAVLGGKP